MVRAENLLSDALGEDLRLAKHRPDNCYGLPHERHNWRSFCCQNLLITFLFTATQDPRHIHLAFGLPLVGSSDMTPRGPGKGF